MNARTFALLLVAVVGLGGCAAVGLTGAALGASALSTGAGAAVHAGAEYTRNGTVYRTFSLPAGELRLVVSETLARLEIPIERDEDVDGERRITARARGREIDLRLQPLTRTMTRMRLLVSEGRFRKDRATASEIVAQTERVVEDRVSASGRGAAAAFPQRDARR